jgi:hypothetical protein
MWQRELETLQDVLQKNVDLFRAPYAPHGPSYVFVLPQRLRFPVQKSIMDHVSYIAAWL